MTPVSPVQETWLEMIDLSLSSNNNDTGQCVVQSVWISGQDVVQ